MTLRRLALPFAFLATAGVFAESADMAAARSALRDGLYSIAEKRAEKAMANSDETGKARLVVLEALAKSRHFSKIIGNLDKWGEASNEKFRYWRAFALAGLKRHQEAIDVLAADFHDESVTPMALRLKARSYAELGDFFASDANYEKVLSGIASNETLRAEVSYERACMLKDADRAKSALEAIDNEKLLSAKGETGDSIRLLVAELSERLGDGKRAAETRKAILSDASASEAVFANAAFALSKSLWNSCDTNGAIKVAADAVAKTKSKKLKMLAAYNLGEKELAVPALEQKGIERMRSTVRANLDAPESCAAQIALSDALLKSKRYAEANREYRYALETFPRLAIDEHTIEGCAWALTGMGKNAEAVAMFVRAAQVATNETTRTRCFFKEGDVLVSDGKFDNAVAAYGKISQGPYFDEARYAIADALARAGKTEESLGKFTELANDEKASREFRVKAALRMATGESEAGRYESAIAVFTKIITHDAVKQKPDSLVYLEALEGRGRAYYRSYRYREASGDFETLAKLRPETEDEMRFFVALCKYGEGENDDARMLAAKLLEKKLPDNLKSEIVMWLAKFDFLQGDYGKARKGFEIYANDYPKFPRAAEALVFAARSAAARNDFTDCVELVAKCAKSFPSSPLLPEALVLQGEALMELARFDEAVLVLERAERSAVSPVARNRALMLKADCIFAMGADNAARYTEAIAAYTQLARTAGVSASAKLAASFKIGRALEKLRRFDEAADQYYSEVVFAYLEAGRKGEWFDEDARAFFARAAFALVDYYETAGHAKEATAILKLVEESGVSAADEAKRRRKKLREKTKGK
jgi:tetratricopeptide (TPR) repeat protein